MVILNDVMRSANHAAPILLLFLLLPALPNAWGLIGTRIRACTRLTALVSDTFGMPADLDVAW